MYSSLIIQSQLLATKFFVPVASGPLIWRPRLTSLLADSLKHPLTLLSAPAGFGKTTLLSTWVQSLPASQAQVAWLSLDEKDNDPQLFWTYVLSALDQQQPERFSPLVKSLQSPGASLLTALISRVEASDQPLVLILDDYHMITEQQVHATLWYLINHLPPQLHLILATRADPPLPLAVLCERRQLLEVRTEQLRCTAEEAKAFLHEVMALQLPDQTIQEVTARTEGWLVGIQLLGLSLPEQVDPLTLLQQVSGEHYYILDYLTEVVLYQQSEKVQHFLLCTSILERLNASLCDAVMEQTGSQEMLKHLERANLFVVSLDSSRQWYRYHALFAQALFHQLEQTHPDLVPLLHDRASRWYAQHHQTTQAILHAFEAKEWHWAADLLEQAHHSMVSFTWGVNRYTLVQFWQWMEQLPTEILASRPRLCLASGHLLSMSIPHTLLSKWLELAEEALRASLNAQTSAQASQGNYSPQEHQEMVDLLGRMLTLRCTHVHSFQAEGQPALAAGEQALAHLSADNTAFQAIAIIGMSRAYYISSANDAVRAIEYGYRAARLTQEAKQPVVTACMVTMTIMHLIGAGRLHEAEQLAQQVLLLETLSNSPRLPEVGWINFCQAELLRERNDLAAARALATEAIPLCEQSTTLVSLYLLYWGYAVQIRISLSYGDLAAAGAFLQQTEQIGKMLSQQVYLAQHAYFTIVDQVRLWLACDELERVTGWAGQLYSMQQHLVPFARERQEVARARILLATKQPRTALQCLEPARQRATAGQRWGHVIEIRLLQALAHQRLDEGTQAFAALSEAVRLAEPEGYLRSFVEEGAPMADLLSRLREAQRHTGPTAYLDTLLAAFAKESKRPKCLCKQSRSRRPR